MEDDKLGQLEKPEFKYLLELIHSDGGIFSRSGLLGKKQTH